MANLQTELTPPKVIYRERERAYYISSTGAKGRLEALTLPLPSSSPILNISRVRRQGIISCLARAFMLGSQSIA